MLPRVSVNRVTMSPGCDTQEETQFGSTVQQESSAVLYRLSLLTFKLQSCCMNAQVADMSACTQPNNLYMREPQVPLADHF